MDAIVPEGFFFNLSIWLIPALLAITLHEAAHGWMAEKRGDNTARSLGRVSFNPLVHVDAIGTVILPLFLLMTGAPFLFGYAKPVPVNFRNLYNPRIDMVWVALAGPLANILLIVIAVILTHFLNIVPEVARLWLMQNLINMILINAVLAVFNMIPLPPLDGGRVAVGLLPDVLARPLARLEKYGMLILISLIFIIPVIGSYLGLNFNLLFAIIEPPVRFLGELAYMFSGFN